jgi:hypothetical protein
MNTGNDHTDLMLHHQTDSHYEHGCISGLHVLALHKDNHCQQGQLLKNQTFPSSMVGMDILCYRDMPHHCTLAR